jgi:hypothetical protein
VRDGEKRGLVVCPDAELFISVEGSYWNLAVFSNEAYELLPHVL